MEKDYERWVPYEKIFSKLRRKGERNAKRKRNSPYLVHDGTTITVDEMAQAVDTSWRKNLAAGFTLGLAAVLKISRYKYFQNCVGGGCATRGNSSDYGAVACVCSKGA